MNDFIKDSEILADHGEWYLVIYAKRCVALVRKDGVEIKSLLCCSPDNDDGTLSDEAKLLEKLNDLHMEKIQECEDLKTQLNSI